MFPGSTRIVERSSVTAAAQKKMMQMIAAMISVVVSFRFLIISLIFQPCAELSGPEAANSED
jgi:hypothetical protein